MRRAHCTQDTLDAIAVTTRPGLSGSLAVGLAFAKGLAFGLQIPYIAVDHILAHCYACRMEHDLDYPHMALLLSGGHTIIGIAHDFDRLEILGGTVDDACGEAFDKIATHLELGYPGGKALDDLARTGDERAADLPQSRLKGADHRYDVSYSGIKTAVIHQLDRFWNPAYPKTPANLAAAFQRAAIDMIFDRLLLACRDTGITTVAVGGGVAANSRLRTRLTAHPDLRVCLPSFDLCTDNGAMIAGLGYHYLLRGQSSDWNEDVVARVSRFRRNPQRSSK